MRRGGAGALVSVGLCADQGISRDSLDPHLDELRLGGLIHLTDWVQGHGQGYALTPEGVEVVQNPRLLARLKDGRLPLNRNGAAAQEPPAEPAPLHWERGEAARAALLTPSVPRVTFALLFINIVWFLVGLALAVQANLPANLYLFGGAEKPEDALQYSAILRLIGNINGPDFYLGHQWWRLITFAFVHIGLIHLGVNMLSLYWVGPLLERMWGHARFLILYVIVIVGGSCGMLLTNPVAGSAGASGAIWGILASMATWLFLNRRVLPPAVVASGAQQLLMVFVLNVFITFSVPSISKGGHFGGGIVGLIAAVPLDYLRFGRPGQRRLALVALFAIPLLCVAALSYFLAGSGGEKICAWEQGLETELWDAVYAPKINRVADGAEAVYENDAKPLLQRAAAARDPAAVEKAVAGLARMKAQVSSMARKLDTLGPFYMDRARQAWNTAREYLAAWAQLLQRAEEALAPGGDAKEKETQVVQQEEQVNKIRQRWQELFHPSPNKKRRKDKGDRLPPLAVKITGRSRGTGPVPCGLTDPRDAKNAPDVREISV